MTNKYGIEKIINKVIEEKIIEELKPLLEANRKAERILNNYQFHNKDIDPTYLNSLWNIYKETQVALCESKRFAEKILDKRIYIYTTDEIEIK